MSYSSEFRKFVVKKISAGMSPSAASGFFEVSRKSIYNWIDLHKETNSFDDKKRKAYKPKKIDITILLEELKSSPDATLEELASKFNCWPQSIHKRFVSLGITRKKNYPIRRKK